MKKNKPAKPALSQSPVENGTKTDITGKACHEGEQIFDNQAEADSSTDLLSLEELGERLNISPRTIQRWRYQRVIPASAMVKIGPRLVRYHWPEIKRWLQDKGDFRKNG